MKEIIVFDVLLEKSIVLFKQTLVNMIELFAYLQQEYLDLNIVYKKSKFIVKRRKELGEVFKKYIFIFLLFKIIKKKKKNIFKLFEVPINNHMLHQLFEGYTNLLELKTQHLHIFKNNKRFFVEKKVR